MLLRTIKHFIVVAVLFSVTVPVNSPANAQGFTYNLPNGAVLVGSPGTTVTHGPNGITFTSPGDIHITGPGVINLIGINLVAPGLISVQSGSQLNGVLPNLNVGANIGASVNISSTPISVPVITPPPVIPLPPPVAPPVTAAAPVTPVTPAPVTTTQAVTTTALPAMISSTILPVDVTRADVSIPPSQVMKPSTAGSISLNNLRSGNVPMLNVGP